MLEVADDTQLSNSLADLSRNASVISTSSSSSSSSSRLGTPLRPLRPPRPFSAPRRSRSRDPHSPSTPRNSSRPPTFLTKDLTVVPQPDPSDLPIKLPASRSRQNSIAAKFSANDFTFDHNPLGEGAYSEVLKGTHNATQKVYAVKIVDKKLLMREGKVSTAHGEKNALTKLGGANAHPGIIKLHWTFQDDWSLYFVLELAPNGDLQTRIYRLGSLSSECARYYMAQVVDAIFWMHSKGVLHRDLKPENVLLDSEMRVKLTDFGTSKSFDGNDGAFRATTWVGTAQYIAPELILHTYTCRSSDIWAVGCMLFQCISGRFPFVAKTQYLMWEKVKMMEYDFPKGFDMDAMDLVERILVLEPEQRLGAGVDGGELSPKAFRDHKFFESIQWNTLWDVAAPPLKAGLYAKEMELDEDGEPYDAGAAWDALVSNDGIPWVNGVQAYSNVPLELLGTIGSHDNEIAPHQTGRSESTINAADTPSARASSPPCSAVSSRSASPELHPFPQHARGSFSTTGSHTISQSSSSEVAEDNVDSESRTDLSRGTIEPWLATLLPSETAIFSSPVIPRPTLRQRASSILPARSPIRLPAPRVKRRQLVLTTNRLLCLKLSDSKPPRVKSTVSLASKRLSVERKGDRDFFVQAGGKSYTYALDDPALAARWVQQIQDAMDTHRGRSMTRTREQG